MLSRVDLPQPEGPVTATNSPARHVEVDAAQRPDRREVGLEGPPHASQASTTPASGSPSRRRPRRSQSCRSPTRPRLTPAGPARALRRPAVGRHQPVGGHGRRPPLDQALPHRSSGHGAAPDQPRPCAALSTVVPAGRARSCSRWARFTVSPTSVYSRRSSLPSRPRRPRRCSARCPGRRAPGPAPAHARRGRAAAGASPRPHRTARAACPGCGSGAPNTAITASPTYCMTVPASERMAAFIALRWALSWPASAAGSERSAIAGVAADVGHQDGDRQPLGAVGAARVRAQPLGQAAGQQPGERLALLLLPQDRRVQHPQPGQRLLLAGRGAPGEGEEQRLDGGVDRLGRRSERRRRSP